MRRAYGRLGLGLVKRAARRDPGCADAGGSAAQINTTQVKLTMMNGKITYQVQ